MAAKSKRAKKVRVASEFTAAALRSSMTPPPEVGSVYSWSLEEIRSARDQQMRGQFARAAQLAAAMRTDDAIAVARGNRLSPLRCIRVEIVPAKGARGRPIADEAVAQYGQDGVAISLETCASIEGCFVDHGIAFATNTWTARDDGMRVDCLVSYYPIEHVRWDAYRRCYVARVDSSVMVDGLSEVDIIHGDGRWLIFSEFDHEPYKQHAAILSAALVWAVRAFGLRDWAKGSVSHGSAKVIATLPEGVALQSAEGTLTPEATALAALVRDVATSDAPAGIMPFGAELDLLTNNSTAWQIFETLVSNRERAAARIYQGTDGALGANGGAPGVDISVLFGVASTKVQGDSVVLSRGLQTGSIEIWTAINFGDSTLAPTRRYMLPDADGDADRASLKVRSTACFDHIKAAKELGFVIDQTFVDDVAAMYDVDPATLPVATDAKVPTIQLAPTDLAGVVSVNEARASAGLGPLVTREGIEDPDGFITVGEYTAKKAMAAKPAVSEVIP